MTPTVTNRSKLGRQIRRARARAGHYALVSLFEGLSFAGRLHPQARMRRHGLQKLANIPYRDTGRRAHLLDIYRPIERRGPLPVVLYVHGGAFAILSKDTHWIMGLSFARRGFVVFNINYRLAPEHRYPAAIEDTCHALAWVRANAARYGGDPDRIIYAGESAGANLVTALAVASSYRRPQPWARAAFDGAPAPKAVIAACGMLQVSDAERLIDRRLSRFVSDRLLDVPRLYLPRDRVGADLTLADPLVFLERGERPERPLPPFFAFAGTRDPLLNDTRRLKVALDALGVPCEARYYPGGLHAFHALVMRGQARQCWRHQFRFLERAVQATP